MRFVLSNVAPVLLLTARPCRDQIQGADESTGCEKAEISLSPDWLHSDIEAAERYG